MTDITIATIQDIEGMIAVRHDTWLTTYQNESYGITIEDLKAKLEEMHKGEAQRWADRITSEPSCKAWVAKEADKVVGFISVQKLQNENKIWSLYILSQYQAKGIGRQLMNEALAWLDSTKRTILEVASYNTNAINFYKSFGFVEHGEIKNDPVGVLPSGKIIPETLMVRT